MTCDHVRAYLLEAAPAAEGPYRAHLDGCSACAAVADTLREADAAIDDALTTFAEGGPSFELTFARAERLAAPPRRGSRTSVAVALAAAATLALLVWPALRPAPEDEPATPQVTVSPAAAPDPSPAAPAPAPTPSPAASSPAPVPPAPSAAAPALGSPVPVITPPAVVAPGFEGRGAGCAELAALEPAALLGRLTPPQRTCLQVAWTAGDPDAVRDATLLLTDAEARGDDAGWIALAERRLAELGGDADVAYRLALRLAPGGASTAARTVAAADQALALRSAWTGATWTHRVETLYKVRAAAYQATWLAAEEEARATPSVTTRAAADQARTDTRAAAEDWVAFARAAGRDERAATKLCRSAGGCP